MAGGIGLLVLGLARITVRFVSESLFGLTQSSFLSSRHGPRLDLACSSARFGRSPAQLKVRRIAVRLGSARYSGLSASWLVARVRLGARLGTRESACSAWLSFELGSGLSWGLAVESGFGLVWLRAQLGSLVSAWCLGSAQASARLRSQVRLDVRPTSICIPNAIFKVSAMR